MTEAVRTVGRYEVLGRIGRGGMAVVHLARQSDLDRLVALKQLIALDAEDPSFAHRFLREARVSGALSHPNIVTVFDYFEHDGTPYIAMEYLERGSLRRYVGHLTIAQIIGVLEEVLAGLAHAERRSIVHRDLKPENLMVTAEGHVKVADFGIAKATTKLRTEAFKTQTGTTVGTPTYMAPEQAMAQNVGPWTDLYSLGCIAFELFTGQVPYHDTDEPLAILLRHINEPLPPIASLVQPFDARLSDWVAALLVKDPAQRVQSAPVAWDELEQVAIALFGPRWRREAGLLETPPDGDATRRSTPVPGPYTPPPSDLPPGPLKPRPESPPAEFDTPGYETYHEPPRPRPPVEEEPPTEEVPRRREEPVAATDSPTTIALPQSPEPTPRGLPVRRLAMVVAALGIVVAVAVWLLSQGSSTPPRASAAPFDLFHTGHDAMVMSALGAGVGNGAGTVLAYRDPSVQPLKIDEGFARVPGAPQASDDFGSALASEDFNGDGNADLAIGIPGKSRVSVIYGTRTGLSRTRLGQLPAPRAGSVSAYGWALAAEDFNDDRYGDLAVGAPGDSDTSVGKVRILFGSSHGLKRTDGRWVRAPAGNGQKFGNRLAAGDVDGDGRPDLLEGSQDKHGSTPVAGHGSFCRGTAKGPTACRKLGSRGTSSLAVADVTGDRRLDVVQGDSDDPTTPADATTAGEVRVWSGDDLAQPLATFDQEDLGLGLNNTNGDDFGAILDAGDIDGDGRADIVVDAPGRDDRTGRVFIIRGDRSGFSADGNVVIRPSDVGVDAQPKDEFGSPLSLLHLAKGRPFALALALNGVGDRAAHTHGTLEGAVFVIPDAGAALAGRSQKATEPEGLDAIAQAEMGRIRLARPSSRLAHDR